ncbi:MAG: efflux RND transporter periplasmic adaptor subunit [Puniceicoccales bacterium]|jgi:RND family efflux transporter MFP subunit|nr:efflux RND transporter periplasmic adaptor subunit [Puniceicoccales bacterium]
MCPLKLMIRNFFVLGFILIAGCGKKAVEPQKGRPPVPVVVAKGVRRDIPVTIGTIGRCRAYSEVDVVAQVNGEILSINFDEGASVQEGQALFSIDDRKYAANLKSAEAELDRHRAQLSIDQVQQERSQALIHKDYISKQEFETYSTRVEQDRANVAAAEAAIIRAKVDWEHCSIKAPISGWVGKRFVDRGAVVNPSQSLVTVRRMSPLSVDFFVSENDFPKLRQQFQEHDHQLNLDIALIADKGTKAKGVLKFLDNKIDYESGMIHLRGEFENGDYKFWPGNTVSVSIELELLKGALVVPVESIKVDNRGRTYLYQVKEDETSATKYKAVQIFPEIGFQNESFAVIRSGINEGDTIILRGNMLLGAGSDVIPMPDGASGGFPGGATDSAGGVPNGHS